MPSIVQWLVEKLLTYLTSELAAQMLVALLRAAAVGLKAVDEQTDDKVLSDVLEKLAAVIEEVASKLVVTK